MYKIQTTRTDLLIEEWYYIWESHNTLEWAITQRDCLMIEESNKYLWDEFEVVW